MSSHRRNPCGKRRFKTQVDAMISMMLVRKRSERDVLPCRAYECARCRGWHLTSQPEKVSP